MRIKENIHDGCESYPKELQERVESVFKYTSQITELKRLLAEIKKESVSLRALFWTENELKERRDAISFFDARMQATVYYTLRNIEQYLQNGWKNIIYCGKKKLNEVLLYEGDHSDERFPSIQEKK